MVGIIVTREAKFSRIYNEHPSGVESKTRQRVLQSPWMRPPIEEPLDAKPGHVLLVAVTKDLRDATLVDWGPERDCANDTDTSTLPIGMEAERAHSRAAKFVLGNLPFTPPDVGIRSGPRMVARFIFSEGRKNEQLEGSSFGLAMLLSELSTRLRVKVPSHICALAALDRFGNTVEVDALARKMRAVADSALGVSEVLVSSSQQKEAEQIAQTLSRKLKVQAVSHSSEVIEKIFFDLEKNIFDLAKDVPIETQVRRLLSLSLRGSSLLLSWKGVSRYAALLEKRNELDSVSRQKLSWARSVADRHQGIKAPIEWPASPTIHSLPRPLRLQLISHVLQSHADAFSKELPKMVSRAREHIASDGERHEQDLSLLGAIGRGLSFQGFFEEARRYLEEAIEGWYAIDQADKASYPLSELFRILGIQKKSSEIEKTIDELFPRFQAESDPDNPTSFGYVAVAMAYSFIQTKQLERAAELLCDNTVDWEACPVSLRAARLRWYAKALTATGPAEKIDQTYDNLHRLVASHVDELEVYALLAELDSLLEREGDPTDVIGRLLSCPEKHVFEQIDDEKLTDKERAKKFAELYPY